ncbi:hypothetical protein Hanom_Chr02g00146311 [Helianthus anomalus]
MEELRQQVKQLEKDKKWVIGSGLRRFGLMLLQKGEPIEKLPAFKPNSLLDFVAAVKDMEALSYPYIEALSRMVDRPMAELKALETAGLNKELCEQLLMVASVKRALFGTGDEEDDEACHSSNKLRVCPDPEPFSAMYIPIDAPLYPL